MKIAVTADVHLNEKHHERFDAFKNIVNQVRNKNIKYLIVAGDLFDQDDISTFDRLKEHYFLLENSEEKIELYEQNKGNWIKNNFMR